MAEDKERESGQSIATWGTWEELLLASAVMRHGFKDWNSVAMEVQARSSLPHPLTTASNCELKFLDLKRRFTSFQNDAVLSENGAGITDNVDSAVPWVDELRKLRVAELRRELKVKRLEEERDQGLNDSEAGTGKPDLKTEARERRSENDKKLFGEPDHRSGSKGTVVKPAAVTGEDSDREDFSVNQSNSTGSKSGNRKSTAENTKSETKPEFTGSCRPEPNRRAAELAGPQSDDGSTDTVVKNPTCDTSGTTKKKKETKRVDDSSELTDSEAESNGGETATRESSEVQSSASLTGRMKRRRFLRKEISGGSSGNEPRRTVAVKSRRFDEVLQMIRSHKHGSLFESRLQSQETVEYKGMIRQHLDLETVQAKLNSGSYPSSSLAFYRDLLLLCNNAVTFFPNSSKESVAARELRLLVSYEMKSMPVARADPSPGGSSPPNPSSQSKGPPDLEGSQSLPAKRKSHVPIVVCRKRSKISSKLSSSGLGEKSDRTNDDEKLALDLKSSVKMASTDGTTKDSSSKIKERSITGARSMRRSNDSATNSSGPSIKKQTTNSGWKPNSANETETPTPDKKKSETVALEKKRSAADFLKRIKQNSPAETTKRNGRGGSSNKSNAAAAAAAGEQKKGSGKNGGKEKASSIKQSNEKKRLKEDPSPSKRSVGRPPKKAVEANPDPNPAPTKRAREGGGKEPLKRARKRARR